MRWEPDQIAVSLITAGRSAQSRNLSIAGDYRVRLSGNAALPAFLAGYGANAYRNRTDI